MIEYDDVPENYLEVGREIRAQIANEKRIAERKEAQIGFDSFNKTFKALRNSLDNVYMIELESLKPNVERLRELAFAIATLEFFDSIFQDNYDMAMNDYNVKEYGEQDDI